MAFQRNSSKYRLCDNLIHAKKALVLIMVIQAIYLTYSWCQYNHYGFDDYHSYFFKSYSNIMLWIETFWFAFLILGFFADSDDLTGCYVIGCLFLVGCYLFKFGYVLYQSLVNNSCLVGSCDENPRSIYKSWIRIIFYIYCGIVGAAASQYYEDRDAAKKAQEVSCQTNVKEDDDSVSLKDVHLLNV